MKKLEKSLFRVCKKGNIHGIKVFIEKGADVNTKDKDGFTVLMCASENGYTDIVKYLIEKGAKD